MTDLGLCSQRRCKAVGWRMAGQLASAKRGWYGLLKVKIGVFLVKQLCYSHIANIISFTMFFFLNSVNYLQQFEPCVSYKQKH